MAMERERKLTDAGTEIFMDKCRKYGRQLKLIHKDIDILIRGIEEHPDDPGIDSTYEQ